MKTVEELRKRITSVEDMQSVVSTMKSLAAARIRQYESAANATKAYDHTIRLAFQILMRDKEVRKKMGGVSSRDNAIGQQLDPPPTGLILLGSDQGFCGRFNESVATPAIQIAEHAKNKAPGNVQGSAKKRSPAILAIGSRLHRVIEAAGFDVQHLLRLPNSAAKIGALTQQIIVKIEQWQNEAEIEHIKLFYNQRKTASSYAVQTIQLLPIATEHLGELGDQPWPSRSQPIYPLSWGKLFSTVVQQHLFLQLFRACAESLASENASRIAAMQKAESNIDQRLEQLNIQFNQSRQRAITEELLDIISGFETTAE